MRLSCVKGDDGRSGSQVGARVWYGPSPPGGREKSPAPGGDCLPTRPASRAALCQGNYHAACPFRVDDDGAAFRRGNGREARAPPARFVSLLKLGGYPSNPHGRTGTGRCVPPQGVREFTSSSCYSSVRRNRGREK